MKKIFSLILALTLFLVSAPLSVFAETLPAETTEAAEAESISQMELDAQGVYLINLETETVLYSKAENARMFPASLTKLMTALVVLREDCNLKEETITVTSLSMFDEIIRRRGVHMGLKNGETFTVYDLLAGLIIESYCDAADLLAQHFGDGEISAFVQKMNQTAQSLGLKDSNFENAHGLHHANHYSSPRDMAVILRELLNYDVFREIITLRNYSIPATEHVAARKLNYTVNCYKENNKYYLPCFVGGKSGFTNQAGRCLATYSEQDGVSYVSVLIGANLDGNRKYPGNMAEIETNALLSYAYENYELKTVFKKGQKIASIPVEDSEKSIAVTSKKDVQALIRKGSEPVYEMTLPKSVSVEEIKDGKKIGSMHFTFNDVTVDQTHTLVFSWDGKPIETKSALAKGAEGAAKAVSGIFREDKVFLILFICLLLVTCLTLPILRFSHYLHRRKSHKPKH